MKKNDDIPQEIKIQVGGMARSGSTLLYNIMKLLLKDKLLKSKNNERSNKTISKV